MKFDDITPSQLTFVKTKYEDIHSKLIDFSLKNEIIETVTIGDQTWTKYPIGLKNYDNGLEGLYYFAYGEMKGYKNNEKEFSQNTYIGCYANLESEENAPYFYDGAYYYLGGDFRTPTKDDFKQLCDNCNTEWIDNYNGTNVNGLLFTSKTNSSQQLFFPAAGYCSFNEIRHVNETGFYWSSTRSDKMISSYKLLFNSHILEPQDWVDIRYFEGLPLFAICKTN